MIYKLLLCLSQKQVLIFYTVWPVPHLVGWFDYVGGGFNMVLDDNGHLY